MHPGEGGRGREGLDRGLGRIALGGYGGQGAREADPDPTSRGVRAAGSGGQGCEGGRSQPGCDPCHCCRACAIPPSPIRCLGHALLTPLLLLTATPPPSPSPPSVSSIPLVELAKGMHTSHLTYESTLSLCQHLGKNVCVSQDRPVRGGIGCEGGQCVAGKASGFCRSERFAIKGCSSPEQRDLLFPSPPDPAHPSTLSLRASSSTACSCP